MNKKFILPFILTMAETMNNLDNGTIKKYDKSKSVNEKRKCFRKGCNNMRINSKDLYCSEECKQLNH